MSLAGVVREVVGKVRSSRSQNTSTLSWLSRAYVLDWLVVILLHFLASYVDDLPVFERAFSPVDPTISFPYALVERVSSRLNNWTSILASSSAAILLGLCRRSLFEIHQGILTALAARGLNDVITDTLKNRVGRLRPDFLERCAWDILTQSCTGGTKVVKDGRRSFPSGHSSTAFVGMTVVVLLLASKTGALCFSAPTPSHSILGSRLARLTVTILPLFWSGWVAITRLEDYRHHKEDVIVGSIIGLFSGLVVYLTFWPSPFSTSSFAPETYGSPRPVYSSDSYPAYQHEAYEPASQEEIA